MGTISNIFREFGDEYLLRYANSMPANHIKAIKSMQECRTKKKGANVYQCGKCHKKHFVLKGCGSRNCPNCQQHKTYEWAEKRLENRLPGQHFMITFTIPEELRSCFRANQKVTYDAFFKASSAALRELAKDPRFIGIDLPGFFGVLHTWGRQLQYHPHIHYIVPGGGIDKKTKNWKRSREDFYVSVHALSALFRGKLKALLREHEFFHQIDKSIWEKSFVVNSQALGENAEGAIKYLAPYVFRVAISDSRIISVKNRNVTFKYKRKDSNRYSKITLDVMEFIRRFLQHVLPSGFMKVRYYGFMSGSCKMKTPEIITMIEMAHSFRIKLKPRIPEIRPEARCKECGGKLKLVDILMPSWFKSD